MKNLVLLWRVARAVGQSGILAMSPRLWPAVIRAWRAYGPSYAFLARLACLRFARRTAVLDEIGELTFQDLWLSSVHLAQRLSEGGIESGDQVAILSRNHRGFVQSLVAVTMLGADALPLNPEAPPAVIEKILNRQGVTRVVGESPSAESLPVSIQFFDYQVGQFSSGRPLGRPRRTGQLVVLTSGSTGVAKGIRRRPGLFELLPVTAGLLEDLPLKRHQPTALAIPFFHGYGLATLAMALALGSPLAVARRYEISPLLERLPDSEPPLLVTVPTLLARWLSEPSLRPLRAIVTGSAPLSSSLCRELMSRCGPIVFNLYGSTEAGLIALATPSVLDRAPGSVGRPLPGNEVEVRDQDGRSLAPGKVGSLWVKGPLVLQPGHDGWRDTGDLGSWCAGGYLHVCGRADSMIVSGGENVYPHELEEALLEHPLVREVAVLAMRDSEFGQRLVAAVVVRDGECSAEELREWLRPRLERHKLPRSIHCLGSLPKNSLGKIDRQALYSHIIS